MYITQLLVHTSPVVSLSQPASCVLNFATKSVHHSGIRKILHKIQSSTINPLCFSKLHSSGLHKYHKTTNTLWTDKHTYKHRAQTKISPVPAMLASLCAKVFGNKLISYNCCQEVVRKLLHKSPGSFISHFSVLLGKVPIPFLDCFYMLLWQISYNHFHSDLLEKPIHFMM